MDIAGENWDRKMEGSWEATTNVEVKQIGQSYEDQIE